MFQKLGLLKPYETKDEGRFKETKDEADKFVFKVPGLRNVAKTGREIGEIRQSLIELLPAAGL